jgi:hypothetical protein
MLDEDYGHWKVPAGFNPKDYYGFVYLIKNKVTGVCYIGRKFLRGQGKKNKGVESDWKRYKSSSKKLNETIATLGKDAFDFIILEGYKTRSGLSFAEIWSLCMVEAPAKNDQWLNRRIDKVSFKVYELITERHKRRLKLYCKAKE